MKKITLLLFGFLFSSFIYSQTALSLYFDIDAQANDIYVTTMGLGVIKSTDSGDTWLIASTGIEGKAVSSLAISPQNAQNLVATVWNH